jgi:hypothetical protein
MILFKKRNSQGKFSWVRVRDEPYLLLNIFFAGMVVLIIAYSGFFSPEQNRYPVVCLHEKITGNPCFSCGLSHSFSLIVRGRIHEAYAWNIYGMRVFLFFTSQLIMRIIFSLYYINYISMRKQLIIVDSIGSGMMFLITFWPFLKSIMELFLNQLQVINN